MFTFGALASTTSQVLGLKPSSELFFYYNVEWSFPCAQDQSTLPTIRERTTEH